MQPYGQPRIGSTIGYEERKNLPLRLSRKSDFIRLMLNYPMRTVHDRKLEAWTREASNRRLLPVDMNRLLTQKPLKCFQGLLSKDMLENVDKGWSSIFVIPRDILNLAVNLAVDQLLQNLLSEDDHVCNIHHVLLSTGNAAERRLVMEKIESVLKDKEIMLRLHETFTEVLLINASVYPGQVEVHVRQQIAQQLHIPMIEGNEEWLIESIQKEMSEKKHLVLLVHGDAEEPLDLEELGFAKEELRGVVVLITTESSQQTYDELIVAMDLNIRLNDHLLPWEVFCRNADKERLRSSDAIRRIAVQIVEECGGNLLAIAIVAKSLKNAKHWEDAVDKLRSLHPSYDNTMFHGQSRVLVKAVINFIWHDISEKEKYCLACCLFVPEFKHGKLEIELINDWVSSQLVAGAEAVLILRKLVDHFVLLRFEDTNSGYIHMPEDIYAILNSLHTQNPLFVKKSGLRLVKPPNSDRWHSAVHIDLAEDNLSELPSSPNCLELKVLLLHGNADLTKILPFFFFRMPILCSWTYPTLV